MFKKLVLCVLLVVLAVVSVGFKHADPWKPVLGDVNGDGVIDKADSDIVLAVDVGIPSAYCPMNCGDVNRDGLVDSTDALIILSYVAGYEVRFPIGKASCPNKVQQPPGCFVR